MNLRYMHSRHKPITNKYWSSGRLLHRMASHATPALKKLAPPTDYTKEEFMMLEQLIDAIGSGRALALGGLLIGIAFGMLALISQFCLRSAALEIFHGKSGIKLSVWLLAFSTALAATQLGFLSGLLDVSSARQLAAQGSLAGALIGGLLFGAGMILCRGCSSRLLVLAGRGNLRALLSVLVFGAVALASLNGGLSPLRQTVAGWWAIDGGNARDLLAILPIGHAGALIFGLACLAGGAYFALRGLDGGATVAAAWLFTYQVSAQSFDAAPVQSLSFIGPTAEMLMRLFSAAPGQAWHFDIGLLPGVLVGAFAAAAYKGELKLEGFKDISGMGRYILGAACMGFGGVLAGGCAVGAGVSGAAVFSLTAWVSLSAMVAAAGLTDYLVDGRVRARALPETHAIRHAGYVNLPAQVATLAFE